MADETPVVDRAFLRGAAVASVAAGLIHAAAAGAHEGDRAVVLLFSLCAAAQVGWAGIVALRSTRLVAAAGGLLNGAALVAWVGSRTTGLPFVDSLRQAEAAGAQDLAAASFAVAAVAGTVLALARPRRQLRLTPIWSAGAVVGVMLLAIPAMAAGHSHDEPAAGGQDHDHDQAEEPVAEPASQTDVGQSHQHHDILASLDHEPTDEQQRAADELIDQTKRATEQYGDVEAAIAAGYQSIGDGRSGFEHFVHAGHTANATVLDPNEPESLVYRVEPDGTRAFTTVMYILPPGSTMDGVPDIAGNLTVWHSHDNLCFAPGTTRLAGVVVDGQCRPGGVQRTTSPMLHVWVVPNECGPFAGTDRRQMTGSCVADAGP